MDDPGSFEGMIISPIPERGPLDSHLISFAILKREAAKVFNEPESSTMQS